MKARVYWRNIRVDWGLGSTMQFEIKLDSSVHMMMDMSSCKCLHVKVFVLLYFFLSCLCVDKQKCIIIIIIIIIISSSSDNINGTQINLTTVHKRTSVLTSRFGMISVQQGENLNFFFFYIYKQWFTEQVALSLNTFGYSLNCLNDKNLPQLMLKTIGRYFTL